MASIKSPGQGRSDAVANAYPSWSPRFWHDMRAGHWWRMVARNRFRISLNRTRIAVGVSLFSPLNDLLALGQSLVHGRRIAATEIEHEPLFILGHWRSGTTLLHELLVLDPQFASATTFQCFAPWHFLLSEPWMVRFGGFLLPKKRPMDNMAAGWSLPQEDEFALMNMGVASPYARIAFPRTQPPSLEYLDFEGLSPEALQAWRGRLLWFLRVLTYHYGGRRLVLKSPPHTGRMAELAAMFPNARFVHLARDPRKLFSSTMRLWKSLYEVQALQDWWDEAAMQEYVFECLTRMYGSFERARATVDPSRLADIRYEDLVADPMSTVSELYDRLGLSGFDQAEPLLRERLAGHEAYCVNRHDVAPDVEREILHRWGDYAERYGYR